MKLFNAKSEFMDLIINFIHDKVDSYPTNI